MKKSLFSLFVVCAVVFCISGCQTSYRDGGADRLKRPATFATPRYHTNYDVSKERISDVGESSVLFWFFQFSEGKYCHQDSEPVVTLLSSIFRFFSPTEVAVENAKKSALYNALTKYDADQLLGTVYEYTVMDYLVYTKVSCKVKGFPATAKGVTFNDKKPVILNKWQRLEYISPYEENPVDFSQQFDKDSASSTHAFPALAPFALTNSNDLK